MAFHEIQFPSDISAGSQGGPERKTDVVTLRSGFEQRNSIWANSRRKYDASLGIRDIDDLYDVLEFFEGRRGQLHGFRWKDWSDYRSGYPGNEITFEDQVLGVGDGIVSTFALKKVYSMTNNPWSRLIKKPVNGTVLIGIDGTELFNPGDWSIDYTTGIVTFTSVPGVGEEITAGFEFDVPVRFNSDMMNINLEAFEAGDIQSIEIVEIRV